MTDFTITGSNRYLLPGTFTIDDTVTFTGTRGNDILFGGGGEGMTTFIATPGNDLYGFLPGPNDEYWPLTVADYSGARCGITVDLTRAGGTRTFTDDHGTSHTVEIMGVASDGFGGIDSFAAIPDLGLSSILQVTGSRFADRMVGNGLAGLHGGDGDDTITDGVYAMGEGGNDRLLASPGMAGYLFGGDGHDFLRGADVADRYLSGGAGNDRIFAGGGDDGWVTGEAGNDFIDGGAGNDFIDGGIGADWLLSGAGNDTINPDVEFFQKDPSQARDGARDVIQVTKADLGDYADIVLPRAFEEDRDQIRFADAVKGGTAFRVYHEDQSINPDTGKLWRFWDKAPDDAAHANTILQIDQNGDGFGGATPDKADYFLVVIDADLSLHAGYLLT